MSNVIPNWLAIVAFAVPLLGLAGSAVGYVFKMYLDRAERRHARFFELLGYIDQNGTIAAKVAAIYALRRFTEHTEFIVRFCETQRTQVTGGGAPAVVDELDRTAAFMRKVSNAQNP